MDEKLYKIKKGNEFEFYSTEPSGTINRIVGKTEQKVEIAPLLEVDEFAQMELDRDDTMRKVSIDCVLPNITQKTRQGYNIIDLTPVIEVTKIAGLDFKQINSNTIKLSGTTTTTWGALRLRNTGKVKSGNPYTIYAQMKYNNENIKSAIRFGLVNQSGVNFYNTNVIILNSVNTNRTSVIHNFTPEFEDEIVYFRFAVEALDVDKNYDFELSIQLLEGTYTAENVPKFELYGASPSLDYPSEFENVVKNVKISNCGKNLINATKTYTSDGITCTLQEDKATDSEPYKGYIENITLSENQFLGSFQGYKNYIKDNKLLKSLVKVKLNGTEDWELKNVKEKTQVFFWNLQKKIVPNIGFCNYLKFNAPGDVEKYTTVEGGIYIAINKSTASTVEELKNLLSSLYNSGNAMTFIYAIPTPEKEDLSTENKTILNSLEVYKGINNISIPDNKLSFYPYADTPSLERPSAIESISGDYTINIHGKNFLQDQYNTTSLVQYSWCFDIKANLKPDTTYTISLIGAIDNTYYISEQLASDGGVSRYITMTGERQNITFTTKSDISGAWINSRQMYNIFKNAKEQTNEHIFKDVMLVEGSVAKDYVPYISSNTTIELPEEMELNKLVKEDYIKYDGEINVNSKRIILDGTENILMSSNGNIFRFKPDIEPIANPKPSIATNAIMSNAFLNCKYDNLYNAEVENGIEIYNGLIQFRDDSINSVDDWKAKFKELYDAGNPVEIVYETEETTKSVLSTTEINKMQIFPVIIGENYLTAPSEITLLYYDERTEEEQVQPITITNNGKLLPFGLTVDYNKTNFPLIAEAIEASQTINGADGDLVLDTTYGSRIFEIDAVTDDFLTPEEKEAKKEEIRKFLNSIKKVNTKLIIEPLNRTFEVKYAGLPEAPNLPKCVEFIIPLKSASAYAISNTTYTLDGEGEIESETEEPTGFVCTISGQAEYPQLSLNGYLMAYENVLLEGEQLIIDTKKSTVTKINTHGVKTNAMVYYNHQFPKIQKGTNIFTILSGIDEDKLKIEWNDLLL